MITLPYPPSANRYWRNVNGRMVVSAEAREYKRRAHVAALADRQPLLGEFVAVSVAVYRPRKRGDLDNSLKVVLDALQGVCYHDDSQVVLIQAFRYDDKERPRVEVTVTAFEKDLEPEPDPS